MRLGKKQFDFVVARSVTVELLGKGGDVSVPDSQPMVRLICEITTFYSNTKAGSTRRRNGSRTCYYNLETGDFTRRPTGKKGWDHELQNKSDVEDYVRECLTGVGSEQ